jgi:hypothetical protein
MSVSHAHLLALIHRRLASFGAQALAPYLAEWPVSQDAGSTAPRGADAAPALPVLRWLPCIAADAHSIDPRLVRAVCRAAPSLAWRQTYGPDEVGAAFVENYGWTELFGARGRERAKTAGGLLLLGPNTSYPAHRHEAEEIYLPLSGAADWWQGDAIWRKRPPGTLIRHCSEEIHAMRTGDEPLLALYLWQSDRLSQRARLEPADAARQTSAGGRP